MSSRNGENSGTPPETIAPDAGTQPEVEAVPAERLLFVAPLDVPALTEFFARRAVPGVEEIIDGCYRRSVRLPRGGGVVELRVGESQLRGGGPSVEAGLHLDDPRDHDAAVAACRQLFDLDRDPRPIAAALSEDPIIGRLVGASLGRRVPGVTDPDELAIRAVLGQQVSLAGAATLAARLVADCGEPLQAPVGGVTHLFPTAAAVAAIDPARLAMPEARKRALLGLASALAAGDLALDAVGDHATIRAQLLALPGIGPWTAEYIAMRALRDPDAFLPTDLGVRHALRRLGFDGDPGEAIRLAEAWRPYRAYALQHLWASLAT